MAVADLIREIRPTHVITHWPKGIHKDHIAAFQIVKDAIFYAALPSLKRAHPAHEVLGPYLSENWEDMVDYVPSIFMDVTPFFNEWLSIIRLFQLYAGGVSDYDYVSYYTNLAALRGVSLGVQYAVTLATETTLTAFITRGLDQKLSLYTSMSPIFKPQLKQNTVG